MSTQSALSLRGAHTAWAALFREALLGAPRRAAAIALEHHRYLVQLLSESLRPDALERLLLSGGIARSEITPASDLDLFFLGEADVDEVIGLGVGTLIDAGLPLNYATGTVDELTELADSDLRTLTMLLDGTLFGDVYAACFPRTGPLTHETKAPFELTQERLHQWLRRLTQDSKLTVRFRQEIEARHHKHLDSAFLLEPDIKNGCGYLRDASWIRWAIRARWGFESLEQAVERGVLLARERDQLRAAVSFFQSIRLLLHARSTHRQDRLSFEDQEIIAGQLGFDRKDVDRTVEAFMQEVYRHARFVTDTLSQTLEMVETPLSLVNATAKKPKASDLIYASEVPETPFVRFGHKVTFVDSSGLEERPALALYVVEAALEAGLPLYPFARQAISQKASQPIWAERLRSDPGAAASFLRLLSTREASTMSGGTALQELHALNLLAAMIPEFEPLLGRVQHDVYHVYTVDVHSIRATDLLLKCAQGLDQGFESVGEALVEEDNLALLALSVLVHDIGKGRGGDHSVVGAALCSVIGARLLLPVAEIEALEWLVREHLTLYHWTFRRDVSDPAVLAQLGQVIGDTERLRRLFLLTIVDLATTNPGGFTSWKQQMLEDAYRGLHRHLSNPDALAEQTAEANDPALTAFVATLPPRYLSRFELDEVRRHLSFVQQSGHASAQLFDMRALSADPESDLTGSLWISAPDRAGLLADVAAFLASHGVSVERADVFTRSADDRRYAFDIFEVRYSRYERTAETWPRLLSAALETDNFASTSVVQARTNAKRSAPKVSPRVRMTLSPTEPDGSGERHYLLEVYARDRPRLLADLTRSIASRGFSIDFVRLSTEGHRAIDVFGLRLSHGHSTTELQELESDLLRQIAND